MPKIVFNITELGAWAEIEQADGTMKKWDEELTTDEYVALCSAGMALQKGSAAHAMLACSEVRIAQLDKLRKALDKAMYFASCLCKGKEPKL